MDRLSEIRARCEAATPGPWEKCRPSGEYVHNPATGFNVCMTRRAYDSEFIAHAREDIPYLLEQINISTARAEKAEAERDKAIKAITPCCLNCKNYARDGFGDYDCKRKYAPSETSRCANWGWKGE